MLRIYSCQNNHLALIDSIPELGEATPIVWFDLFNPAQDETRSVEQHLGIEIPTRDEMQEIELSDRLYQEDGAEFMTMTAATELDGDNPVKVPVTFILKGATLVTVRHADPKPFHLYAARMQRLNGASCEERRAGDARLAGSDDRPYGGCAGADRQRDRGHFPGSVPQEPCER